MDTSLVRTDVTLNADGCEVAGSYRRGLDRQCASYLLGFEDVFSKA